MGTAGFGVRFLKECALRGSGLVSASVGSFVQRVLQGGDSLFYRRARLRIGRSLQNNIVPAVEAQRLLAPYYVSHFRDLSQLWFYLSLTKR